MKLIDLLENIDLVQTKGDLSIDIKDIKIDSKSVTKNSLFICLNGRGFDGHNFVHQAELYGARAVVCTKPLSTNLTQIVVKDTRLAMSLIAANFYGHADKKMKIIGVTGTNGKTTTTHIIKSILDKADVKCGLIGTLGTFYDDKFIESDLTTPDPLELHKTFKDMYLSGVKVVVMEVSAHALALNKLAGIKFEVGVFTNLTQDHLDFFGNMKKYEEAKISFFEQNRCNFIVSNSDDETGRKISRKFKNVITYGIDNPADVFAMDVKDYPDCVKFILNLFDCVYNVKINLLGKFNVSNCLAAATTCALIGVSADNCAAALYDFNSVSGRLEPVYKGKFSVYIDYAHTPDGLEKTLSALKIICKGRLVCVFGCGGNRDKSKREIMGAISGKLADFTVITSDNPRFEEPMDIIRQIEKGMLTVSKRYVLVQDREEAIKYALNYVKEGDIVLVAGKGSEKYQEILGIKHIYNDKDTITEIIGGTD